MPGTTRDRIIEATSALFRCQGLAAGGLKQIAHASSAPIGSLYHFFPGGKDELAAGTLRAAGAAYHVLVETIFDTQPDIVSGVRACCASPSSPAMTMRRSSVASRSRSRPISSSRAAAGGFARLDASDVGTLPNRSHPCELDQSRESRSWSPEGRRE